MNIRDIDDIIGRVKGLETNFQRLAQRTKRPDLFNFGQLNRELNVLKKRLVDFLDLQGLQNWADHMELEEADVTTCGTLAEIGKRADCYDSVLDLLIEGLVEVSALPGLRGFVQRLQFGRELKKVVAEVISFLRDERFLSDTIFSGTADKIEAYARQHPGNKPCNESSEAVAFYKTTLTELIEQIEVTSMVPEPAGNGEVPKDTLPIAGARATSAMELNELTLFNALNVVHELDVQKPRGKRRVPPDHKTVLIEYIKNGRSAYDIEKLGKRWTRSTIQKRKEAIEKHVFHGKIKLENAKADPTIFANVERQLGSTNKALARKLRYALVENSTAVDDTQDED